MRRRRRQLLLCVLALALLGSCTAATLSLAGGRDGAGVGTVTATADVPSTQPGRSSTTPQAAGPPVAPQLGAGSGTVSSAPPTPGAARSTSAPRVTDAAPADVLQPLTLTLAGSTSGLVPGQPSVLPVRVSHDATDDDVVLTLKTVDAVVRGPAGSCAPADLVVTAYDADAPGALVHTLRRGESVVVELPVVLVDAVDRDQTDCAGATFPLTLTATAGVTS